MTYGIALQLKQLGDLLRLSHPIINSHLSKQMTSEATLRELSEAIDAFAAAKVANNETLIKYSISNLQEFLNRHSITPLETEGAPGQDPTKAI